MKNSYIAAGISFGLAAGVLVGSYTGNVSAGIGFGIAAGVVGSSIYALLKK